MSGFNPLISDYPSRLISTIGEKLYLNSELADVHFVFDSNGDNERVPANKAHLMIASDVFATMFNGTWKEKNEVNMTDVRAAVFKEFLQFFYLVQVKLTMENVAAVMNLGEKYNVYECLTVCSKFLKNNLNYNNVLRYYELAILLDQEDLKQSCETIIGSSTQSLFKSPSFLTCNKKMLANILKLNWMLCSEVELFEPCLVWVKAKSTEEALSKQLVLAQLGDLLQEIRFGSMHFLDFATLIPVYGQLFEGDDYATIIQLIADYEFKTDKFNENREKRCESDARNEIDELHCDRLLSKYDSTKPYFIKTLERTKFSTNQILLLKSFTIHFVREFRSDIYITCESFSTDIAIVEIIDTKNGRVKYNGTSKVNTSISTIIELSKSILIRPGILYEIQLKQLPPRNCPTGILLKSQVQIMDDIKIRFHNDPLIPGDISSTGLIYHIDFYRIGK